MLMCQLAAAVLVLAQVSAASRKQLFVSVGLDLLITPEDMKRDAPCPMGQPVRPLICPARIQRPGCCGRPNCYHEGSCPV